MAVFYFPDRSSPTTTLTIISMEKFASSRPVQNMQSSDITPGGTITSYDLGPDLQFIELNIRVISQTDKENLVDFIEDDANWRENTFDFDDDQGVEYNTCRFMLDRHDFVQNPLRRYSEIIEIRVDP